MIDEAIPPFQFIANVGGLLGLFMGFSFISGVEVIYHCFLYLGQKVFIFCNAGALMKDHKTSSRVKPNGNSQTTALDLSQAMPHIN